jgi:hypothetical protein
MALYSVLQLLAVAFNPAFMGNYAVTVMAFMIAFSKYRMALMWLPIAITLICISSVNYYNFELQIAQLNITDAHTLAVKYNFHPRYIEMMESFNNFWLYDYAHVINRIVLVVHIAVVLYMAAYIIHTAPYNSWLLKRRRWDRFISTYINGPTTFSRHFTSSGFLCLAFYIIMFKEGAYTDLFTRDSFSWNMFFSKLFIGVTAFVLSIDWIKYHRGVMIERYRRH